MHNFISSLSIVLFTLVTVCHAQVNGNEKAPTSFQELAPTQQKAFKDHLDEANRLFDQKRVFEALSELKEADKILPDHPVVDIYTARAYMEFRDFDRALVIFKDLAKKNPNNASYLFNIAEVSFVQAKWKTAATQFDAAITLMEATQKHDFLELAYFKKYICHKKQGNDEFTAEMETKYDFSSDKISYYLINYLKYHHEGNDKLANDWLRKTNSIYRPQELASWQDTLREAGYQESLDGGGDRFFTQ